MSTFSRLMEAPPGPFRRGTHQIWRTCGVGAQHAPPFAPAGSSNNPAPPHTRVRRTPTWPGRLIQGIEDMDVVDHQRAVLADRRVGMDCQRSSKSRPVTFWRVLIMLVLSPLLVVHLLPSRMQHQCLSDSSRGADSRCLPSEKEHGLAVSTQKRAASEGARPVSHIAGAQPAT